MTRTGMQMEEQNSGNIVCFHKTFNDLIENNFATLTDTIQLSNLWPQLRQLQVVDQTTEARIKVCAKSFF